MLCKKCRQKMKQIYRMFDTFSFLEPPMHYCMNEKCKEFGNVTMVGYPEDKEENKSKTNPT